MEPLQSGDPNPPMLGEYKLLGRLGEGAMGVVYLALSPGGRKVAIKVIRPELARDPEFRARFALEVATVRKVSGLYTAAVIDAVLDGPVLYLVTVFINGPTLAQSISDNGLLPLSAVQSLAAALAEGLRAIHAQGIVHRDLKPGNVMLAADGPRLIDFGIVRALESSSHTSTGTVLGTPSYMSPEQATGAEVGPPSDIFSLGALLAFAASGRPPFGEGAAVAILFRIASQPADTSGVPAEIRPLIDRCLAKGPAQRPTAGGLLAELGAASSRDALPGSLAGEAAEPGQDEQATEAAGFASVVESVASPTGIARNLRGPTQRERQRRGVPQAVTGVSAGIQARLDRPQEKNRAEARGYSSYEELRRIHTAPEFARRLARLAAEAAGEGVESATWALTAWPAGVTAADIEAVRAGRRIPSEQLLDAYLVSLGVSPDYLKYWHGALGRVHAATAEIINLRTRAIQLEHDLEREWAAVRRRRSPNPLIRTRARMDAQRTDPHGVARASTYGQLQGEVVTLARRLESRNTLDGPYGKILPDAPWSLRDALDHGESRDADGEPVWLGEAIQGVKDTIEALARVQVDASGVDLRNLVIPERDAVIGVIWTPDTKWPDGIVDLIREPRSRRIHPGVFQVI
jgi:hypothetical protein